ncbi:uncharacterized protein LOC112342338 [Selaginella moellendorffii]|uniref:uncharacterized protein LOC112342338 n=1 Tax=Selaginella moellendorffii TaxID=88036 RepID=UPI000D1CB7FE|nr:uncharacterized protein LOC112342338 [Selaginella moellendorffii]|eukprot:XP_024519781.1 uncharacterized protein LOC112342338 [Selaginella moellendorffii]
MARNFACVLVLASTMRAGMGAVTENLQVMASGIRVAAREDVQAIHGAVREDVPAIHGAIKEDVVAVVGAGMGSIRAAVREDLQAIHGALKEDFVAVVGACCNQGGPPGTSRHSEGGCYSSPQPSHGRLFHIPLSGFGWLDQVVSKAQSGAAAGSVIHRNNELFSFFSGIFFTDSDLRK